MVIVHCCMKGRKHIDPKAYNSMAAEETNPVQGFVFFIYNVDQC